MTISLAAVESGENALDTIPIKVLMVDDQPMVGEAMRRMLADVPGIEFHYLQDPTKAIQVATEIKPTVILQDLVMPDVDGLTLVKFYRSNAGTREVPLIVLSSKEEAETKQQAFELGANDYMVKFPEKPEVLARIRYHSKAYINYLERIKSEKALQEELEQAARYMESLLPEKLDTETFKTDWAFISSTKLAGDSFGYHWLDDEHFCIYLLDVCGHGVGAALLSASALNVMRSQSLSNVDFKDPSAVLSGMNEAFDMDKQNGMYFTMWYGVYQKSSKKLVYSSGGHPPAILVRGQQGATLEQLSKGGMIVGGMPGVNFEAGEIAIETNDRLYVFSDGVYEIEYKDKPGMMSPDEFSAELMKSVADTESKTDAMVAFCREAQGDDLFLDDYSLLEVRFF